MGTVVGVKNGFLGNRVGLDVSDWVNPRARALGFEFYLEKNGCPSRGYLLKKKRKTRFRRWLSKHADAGAKIILVGKSMGAHDILTAVEKVGCWDSCRILLFDPAFNLKRGEWYTRKVTCGERVTVVRQKGYRSGYRVRDSADHVVSAKHSNIERTRAAQSIGNSWLARNGLPRA